MKVYILFHFAAYDDSNDVEGVFATSQLAIDHLTTVVEQDISAVGLTIKGDSYLVSHIAVHGVSTEHTAVYFIEEHELKVE